MNFQLLKKYVTIYKETKDKTILDRIIDLHTNMIKQYIKTYENDKLERDEIISIAVITIMEIIEVFNFESSLLVYTNRLKRNIDKNISFTLKTSNDEYESYEYYASQHKNGEENSYTNTLFEDYIKNMTPTAIQNELKFLSEKYKYIINARFGLNYTKSLSCEKIGKTLKISKSCVEQYENRILRKLRHKEHTKKLEYLLEEYEEN